ncbi:hypothetical protein ACTGJ9_039365 [Bradyrhizobium sp. RDM12]
MRFDDVVQSVHDIGFLSAIETNGRLPIPTSVVTGFASANRAALAVTRGHELKIRVAAGGSPPDGFDERSLDNFCFDQQTA